MNQFTIHTSLPYVGILALTLIQPSCTGTEADNPFTDPATTSLCKGEDNYVPLANKRELQGLTQDSLEGVFRAEPAPPPPSNLSSLSEVPVWLECIEWDLSEGIFDYQVANFRGGCAVDWSGGGEVTSDGNVSVELQNKSCAVAGCGNCLYDLRSNGQLEVPEPNDTMTFDLIRTDCKGEVTVEGSWTLPIAETPHGILCRDSDRWGAESAAGNATRGVEVELYAPCDDGSDADLEGRTCADGLNCITGKCVPSCAVDEDCPLSGAFTCQDGSCQLSLAI